MAYFTRLGTIWYTFPGGIEVALNDITKFVSVDPKYKNDPRFYLDYTLKDQEHPATLSNRLYGTPDYHYTIYLMNDITNFNEQWPRDESQLDEYIAEKYPFNTPGDILYYLDINDLVTDPEAMRYKGKMFNLTDDEIIAQYDLTPVSIIDLSLIHI